MGPPKGRRVTGSGIFMANKGHLEILEQGVEAWNEWKKNNPEERSDLSGTKLIGVDLRGGNKDAKANNICGD